ncbi:MAG: MFS transporter [Bacteroidetes bacterium]|nr:MFS transporter [Bacteroidota bacterium]
MLQIFRFARQNTSLLLFGFLLTFFSGFGQTFFISLFVPSIQQYFQISDGFFSGLYALSTVLSAATLSWVGKYIDMVRLPRFTIRVMLGLSLSLLFISQTYYLPVLVLAIFTMRLFGQGLMTHTSLTSMGKFFDADRGKAISLAALGHPAGEAVFPILFVTLIALVGWRMSMLIASLMVFMFIPVALFFLFKNRDFSRLRKLLPSISKDPEEIKKARPLQFLKSKAFWILAPNNFASASIGTAFIFFQLKLGLTRGWSEAFMASSFVAYALAGASSSIVGGLLTDRFSAKSIYPFTLVPFMVGLILFLIVSEAWVYPAFLASIGMTNGFSNPVKNAALAEIYGTKFLGSVRSLFITVMIFSTALGPVVFGTLLDANVSFQLLGLLSLAAMVLCTLNALRIYKL